MHSQNLLETFVHFCRIWELLGWLVVKLSMIEKLADEGMVASHFSNARIFFFFIFKIFVLPYNTYTLFMSARGGGQ